MSSVLHVMSIMAYLGINPTWALEAPRLALISFQAPVNSQLLDYWQANSELALMFLNLSRSLMPRILSYSNQRLGLWCLLCYTCRQEGLARASRYDQNGMSTRFGRKISRRYSPLLRDHSLHATRDMFCTQYKENLNYCLPSVLGNVESESGQKITVDEVMSLLAGKFTAADPAFMSVQGWQEIPSEEAYCNPCGQAIVSQSAAMMDAIREDPVGIQFNFHSGDTVHQISDICGPAFEDQTLPNAVQLKKLDPKLKSPPQAEESRPQAEESRPQAEEARPQAEESRPQAEETRPQAEEARPSGEDA
ncbi:hypothetical protein KEM48_006832 [Puccinia striiformis f. sp. tritici PST-130]|nr:hypothetical protein KEM48_006832 [Puccinia striiformis f. sp. tritici PST-130]